MARNTQNQNKQPGRRIELSIPDPIDFLDRRGLGLFSPRGTWMYSFPRIDITETGMDIKVIADVPGVDPDSLDVEVKDDWMKLSGSVSRESESAAEEQPYRYERYTGAFSREFALPANVKEEEVKAIYKDGVLTVTLPKTEEPKRGKIPIERQ